MTGEAIGEDEIPDRRVSAQDGVVVEGVDLVVPGPGPGAAQSVERRNAVRKRRPERFLPHPRIHLEPQVRQVIGDVRRDRPDERPTLGAEPRPGRIDHQGVIRGRIGSRKHKDTPPPRLHRERDPGHRCDLPGPGTGGVHERAAENGGPVIEFGGGDAAVGRSQADDGRRADLDTQRHGLAPEGAGQAVAVEPTLARTTEGPEGDPLGRHPGEPVVEIARLEELDVGALGTLDRVHLAEGRCMGRRGQVQVAALHEADIDRPLTIDREMCADVAKEREPELRHPDVLGRRELLTDGTRRQRRRRLSVGRVALDDDDATIEPGVGREEVRDRAADDAATDDDDIRAFDHAQRISSRRRSRSSPSWKVPSGPRSYERMVPTRRNPTRS